MTPSRPAGLSGDAGPTPEEHALLAEQNEALVEWCAIAEERVGQLEALVRRINAREIFREHGTGQWCVLHSPDSYEPLADAEPETWALLVARAAVETLEKGTPE